MRILNLNNTGMSLTGILLILIVLVFGYIIFGSLQKPRDIQPSMQKFAVKTKSELPRPVIRPKKKPKPRRNIELPPDFIW